jgi:AcrR family transcriptional regulator
MLQDGLLSIMEHKHVDDITVKELAEAADVARATVYVHYRDPRAVLEQIQQGIYQDIDAIITKRTPAEMAAEAETVFKELFEYVSENRERFMVLMGEFGDVSFSVELLSRCSDYAQEVLHCRYPQLERPTLLYSAEFLVGGCISVLNRWLQNHCAEDTIILARVASRIM